MALALRDCTFLGPALPEPFVKLELERLLARLSPLPADRGAEGRRLKDRWDALRRKLGRLGESGGDLRVFHHAIEPLAPLLGYPRWARAEKVRTREGDEDAGWWLSATDGGPGLRAWTVAAGTDLDAPHKRGRAYRFSPARVAARVLAARGERAGLLTDGVELRLLLWDPVRTDSCVAFALDRGGWRGAREVPDSFRLLLALACPRGVAALPELVDAARLSQAAVTRELRKQARRAVEGFVQGVLDEPQNRAWWEAQPDPQAAARSLWHEGLALIYRLLFVLKMESSPDPARAFSFSATSLWRNSYSPSTALAPLVPGVLAGEQTGGFLEQSLRTLFRLFAQGLSSAELRVSPLGGALFGAGATPLLDALRWGERAVARLLSALLWTGAEGGERARVHYGSLDVEDLGRVYEALLELEPGISTEPMCRLRRARLEVVVPLSQGAAYRSTGSATAADGDADEEQEEADDEAPTRGKGTTQVAWVEDIPAGRFFLRTGLGRKSTGSYYTPHPFVRFLVQETLGPQVAALSPRTDPGPARILTLKVLDPAMGSGHFLVEACRYLGDALYEACRLCDELASTAKDPARAEALLQRVRDLPDPDDELLAWLPSRAPEGTAAGLSQKRAEALCRRLVAVHCLYGVDRNPLAVELAKLALWLESWAEGLPLTFMDHRLIAGDSLTGPFLEHLATWPCGGGRLGEDVLSHGLGEKLTAALRRALERVGDLTASVGKDVADLERKALAKAALDEALSPFRRLAAAWSGGVMLGERGEDGAYLLALRAVAEGAAWPESEALARMEAAGCEGVPWDLVFPEVFHPDGKLERAGGFDAVLGNPPWDAIQFKSREFLAAFDLAIMEAPTARERERVEVRLLADPHVAAIHQAAVEDFERQKRSNDRLYRYQKVIIDDDLAGRQLDAFRVFMERNARLIERQGYVGVVVPGAFHANAGAAGVRTMYLDEMQLLCCYSFENRNKLFEIDSRFKFAAVIARGGSRTTSFSCAFYRKDLDWLFHQAEALTFRVEFVRATGGEYLSLVEPRTPADAAVLFQLFDAGQPAGEWLEQHGIVPNTSELPMMPGGAFVDAPAADVREPATAARLAGEGLLVLHEGKTIHQFDDRWEAGPRYLVRMSALERERPRWIGLARHYRFGYRAISSATNERTGIAALMPPPTVSTRKIASDVAAGEHATAFSLLLCALVNAFSFDFALRSMVQTDVSLFIVKRAPLARIGGQGRVFLAHAALRLTCNHAGYAPLWAEQVGDAWREPTAPRTWPVLAGDEARWAVRAAVDAVVAEAYCLTRAQYAHVLGSFTHRTFPAAADRCLAAFDELLALGTEAFLARHDPYCDLPLVTALPEPVIELGAATYEPAVPEAPRLAADEPPPPPWAALTATDRSVLLLTLLMEAARAQHRLNDVGAVKAEKFLHLAEAHLGIDLEREPVRLAAGPADKPRQAKVFHRARMQNIFSEEHVLGMHRLVPGRGFPRALSRARGVFGAEADEITRLAGLFAVLDTGGAEILATLYAAWNGLLAAGEQPDDDAIAAAFYAWHEEKSRHPRERLDKALGYMREHGLVPTGRARRAREAVE